MIHSDDDKNGPVNDEDGPPEDGAYGGSMYMSYGGGYGDTSGGDDTGFFGGSGSIFGGGMKCCIQNMLIAGIVIFMLYTYVYVPMQQKEMQSCKMNSSQRSSFQSAPDVTVDGVKKFAKDNFDKLSNYISNLGK